MSRDKMSQRRACGRDPPRKKVNMQIVAEKSLWAGPTGEKKKTKNYFVALQIVAEKSLWAGPTGEKRKK
jgi:hypothetical protein